MEDQRPSQGEISPSIESPRRGELYEFKERYNRREVIQAVNSTFNLLETTLKQSGVVSAEIIEKIKSGEELSNEEAETVSKLPPNQRGSLKDYKIASAGMRLTLSAQNKETFVNVFNGPNGENFVTRERLPVDGLQRFLTTQIRKFAKMAREGTATEADLQNLKALSENRYILTKYSKPYRRRETPHRTVPPEPGTPAHARMMQESYRIHIDPVRATGSPSGDWFEAERELSMRRELFLPKESQPDDVEKPSPIPQERALVPYEPKLGVIAPDDGSIKDDDILALAPGAKPLALGPGSFQPIPPERALVPIRRHLPAVAENQPVTDETRALGSGDGILALGPGEAVNGGVNNPTHQTPGGGTEQGPVVREAVIGSREQDLWKRARQEAVRLVQENQRRGSAWNPLNWARKIGLGYMEQYALDRITRQIVEAMRQSNNPFSLVDAAASIINLRDLFRGGNLNIQLDTTTTQQASTEAGLAEVEAIKLRERRGLSSTGEQDNTPNANRNIQEARGPIKQAIINSILRPMVEGTNSPLINRPIRNNADIQDALRAFIEANQNDQTVQQLFGRNSTEWGRLAGFFATDLERMAEEVREDIRCHRYAVGEIDAHTKIILANTRWAQETVAHRTALDNAIAWVEQHRLTGSILNPTVMGVAYSIGMLAGMRSVGYAASTANWVAPGLGSALAGAISAARRNQKLKEDIAGHRVEMAEGGVIGPNAPRRRDLEQFAYNIATVTELTNGGGTEAVGGQARLSLEQLISSDLSDNPLSNRETLLRRVAEIQERLGFSERQRVDLISYEQRGGTQNGRLELLRAITRAEDALVVAGMTRDDLNREEQRLRALWTGHFTQDRQQRDHEFSVYRAWQALGAGVFTSAAAFGGFMIGQELTALGSRELASAGLIGANQVPGTGTTFLEDNVINPVNRAMGFAEWGPNLRHLGTFKELYQNGGTVNLSNALRMVVDPQTHEAFAVDPRSGNPIPGSPKMYVQNDGHIVYRGARLPKELAEATQDWHSQETVKESLRENIRVFAGKGDAQSITENNIRLDINKDQIMATNLDNNVSVQGKMDLTNPDSRMLLEVQGRGAKLNLESLHSALSQNDFQVENITETPLKLPSVLEQVQEAIKDGKVIIFSENGVDFKLDGSQGTWSLVHGPSGITANGVINKATGEFSFDAQKNPGIDVIKVKQYLEAAGFKTRLEERGGGTVIDAVLNQTPDQLKAQRIIETGKIEGEKRWNFHVLRPDYVARTGDHTHNELTMHLGGQRGSNLPLGTLGSTGDLDGVNIQANLRGMPPKNDPELVRLFNRAGGLKHEDLIYIVDLNDGRQISVIPNQQGFAKLPKELYDPNTGYPKGVKVISKTIIEKPDGSVMKAHELLNSGQVPKGSIVHSIAAEKYTSETPPAPKVKMLHALAPNDPKWDYKYQFGAVPPGARELIPHETPETPPFIPIPFAPRHPLERLTPPRERVLPYGAYTPYGELPAATREFYRNRLSERLRNNPDAELDAETEINDYMQRQSPEYRQEIENYLSQDGMREPMGDKCEAVVCLPVYTLGEGKVVKNALENYLLQVDKTRNKQAVDPSKFELVIFLNHPKPTREEVERNLGRPITDGAEARVRSGNPELYDTEEVIRQFREAHPELKIRVMKKEFDQRPVWGKIIKPLYDIALARSMRRANLGNNDPVIITNDIDVVDMSPTYMRDVLQAMDLNNIASSRNPAVKKIDALVGKIDMPNKGYEKEPGFLAAERLYQFLDTQLAHRSDRAPLTQGRNTTLRASTYAAIGGVNPNTDAGGDTELGKMIEYARGNKDRVRYLNRAWLHTDPRRELDMWRKGIPLAYAWNEFAAMNVYGKDWKDRFNRPPKDPAKIDRDFLELEINTEMERWRLAPNSKEIVSALTFLGFRPRDYRVENGKIVIVNINGVTARLQKYVKEKRWEVTDRKKKQALRRAPSASIPNTTYSAEYVDYEEFDRIYNDIFVDKEYPWTPDRTKPKPKIIDLGGHIGLSALYFKSLAPDAEVTVVEANPTTANVLRRNLSRNHVNGVRVIQGAASAKTGKVNLYMPKPGVDFRWGDFVSGVPADPAKYDRVAVPAVKLSGLINGPIDLLKIDIEGSELEVLREAEPKLSQVKELMLEFHINPGNPANSLNDTISLLTRQGYTFEVRQYNKPINPATVDLTKQSFLTILAKRP